VGHLTFLCLGTGRAPRGGHRAYRRLYDDAVSCAILRSPPARDGTRRDATLPWRRRRRPACSLRLCCELASQRSRVAQHLTILREVGDVYAVIDVETTGLYPGGHDRVVEVAVVHLDSRGTVEDRWCTLVNPGRDLGARHIHGIRTADVLDAPTFGEIAGRLARLLRGRSPVAHNQRFDLAFLRAEFGRQIGRASCR